MAGSMSADFEGLYPTSSHSSTTAALWGHLLHKKPHTSLAAKITSDKQELAPLMKPSDKAGASARMLLHDTQAMLERFSGRIDKLHGEVEQAKSEVAMSHKVFQHGNDKMLSDQVDLINRCQTQLQKAVGKPAQVGSVEELLKDVGLLTQKFDGLDRRVDALSMLNQTQLQALQAIHEQQGQLLALLSPILPLVQAIPLHLDSAKNDIMNCVREIENSMHKLRDNMVDFKHTVASTRAPATTSLVRLAPISPCSSPSQSTPRKRQKMKLSDASPSRVTPRKRQRLVQSQLDFSSSMLSAEMERTTPHRSSKRKTPLRTDTSSHGDSCSAAISQPESDQTSQTLVSSAVYRSLMAPLRVPPDPVLQAEVHGEAPHTRQPSPGTGASAFMSPGIAEGCAATALDALGNTSRIPRNPMHTMNCSREADVRTATSAQSSPPRPQSPKAVPLPLPIGKAGNSEEPYALQPPRPSVQTTDQAWTNVVRLELPASCPSSTDLAHASALNKPMSLRDLRAREASSESLVRNGGKRFISVVDLDEDVTDEDV